MSEHTCPYCGTVFEVIQPIVTTKEIAGTWPENDLRRAFVAGAKWWEYYDKGATMWQSDQRLAENEAERRYPDGKIEKETHENETNN